MDIRSVSKNAIRVSSKLFLKTENPKLYMRRRHIAYRKRRYTTQYGTEELIELMRGMGLTRGRTVLIQSSWDEFFNYSGNAVELIEAILEEIGPGGTLAMPANPINRDPNQIFDVLREPSGAGLLSECLRRMPNCKRSIHLTSSVCAIGENAHYLTKDHHFTETPWDVESPYYRLVGLDAVLFSMGLGPFMTYVTPLHCIDSTLRLELEYFRKLFPTTTKYRWRNQNGEEGEHEFLTRIGHLNVPSLARHYTIDPRRNTNISNLEVFSIDAPYLLERGLELGRQGITMYKSPRPRKSLFVPIK